LRQTIFTSCDLFSALGAYKVYYKKGDLSTPKQKISDFFKKTLAKNQNGYILSDVPRNMGQ